jgi:epsilon-lactone hydrolase
MLTTTFDSSRLLPPLVRPSAAPVKRSAAIAPSAAGARRRTRASVGVRRIALHPSARALVTTRLIRWLCRAPPLDLFEPKGMIRLRRQIAIVDRLGGMLGFAHHERFEWQRAIIRGVRTRVMRVPDSEATPDGPVLLYLHGGGFLFRALNGHMNVAMGLARAAGVKHALLPIYRLAPEHPFPAAVDDCLAVYRSLLDRGVEARNIALAGDSAGGGLVLKLLMRLRDQGLPLPACGLLLSPFTDLSCSGGSMSENAEVDPMFGSLPCGASDARDPGCSPLFGDFHGLPPLLTQVGSTERLLDDSLRLAPKVERAGGELSVEVWEGMPHVWHVMGLPESRKAVEAAGRFVREHLGGQAARGHERSDVAADICR